MGYTYIAAMRQRPPRISTKTYFPLPLAGQAWGLATLAELRLGLCTGPQQNARLRSWVLALQLQAPPSRYRAVTNLVTTRRETGAILLCSGVLEAAD
jgi:hypothetical protein